MNVVFTMIGIGVVLYFTTLIIASKIIDKTVNNEEIAALEAIDCDALPAFDGNILVNPVSEYNYLTKNEIYKIRKDYVAKSIFAYKNYSPREEVFGQIIDKKPWWGDIQCLPYKTVDHSENIRGKSHLSIQINNPSALIQITTAYLISGDRTSEYCNGNVFLFRPSDIRYRKSENLISVKYFINRKLLDVYVRDDGKRTQFQL